MSKATATAVRTVELPEKMAHLVPTELGSKERKDLIEEFKSKEQERFKARLEAKVKNLEERLADKNSKSTQVMMRKVLIQSLRNEIVERQNAIKDLKAEIGKLRGPRKVKDGAKAKAKNDATKVA